MVNKYIKKESENIHNTQQSALIKQKIKSYAYRSNIIQLNDHITEEDVRKSNIKQKVKAIENIRKAKLNKEMTQDEGQLTLRVLVTET